MVNIDPTSITANTAGAASASASGKANKPRKKQAKAAQNQLGQEYSTILTQAKKMSSYDSSAVSGAQKAISSGQIDDPQAAHNAAEKIVKYGI